MTQLEPREACTFLDELLLEQQRLTPVERFSRKHDHGSIPAQERYYRDLIPANRPEPGQQYAFAVNLDACTGCKACVAACHSLNGLDDDEIWRGVGLLRGGDPSNPFQQTVTSACHHCVEPACLEGCPVMAYEKDPATGIVRHLDDQCIGCQYCILKCPYDVPKYSKRLGIVRKCDMCIDRLAAGEAPACVQACPTSAIRIELVETERIRSAAAAGTRMIPGAFDSSYTKPATIYRSERALHEGAVPADAADLRLEAPHWPLIGMLLSTQAAAGQAVIMGITAATGVAANVTRVLALATWLLLHLGLAVSVFHLGRPLGAWRFFLGLRTSWMSREILAFGGFAALSSATLATAWSHALRDLLPLLANTSAFMAIVAVFTSGMIYVDTRRPAWRRSLTFPQFFGTTALLGATVPATLLAGTSRGSALAWIACLLRALLFIWDRSNRRMLLNAPADEAHRSALTAARLLPWLEPVQTTLFTVSMAAGAAASLCSGRLAGVLAVIALGSTLTSQVLDRFTYFAAACAPRMPGGVPT